ncbi:cbb3-type cytochrome c oxidase subunit 3 [Pseudomonas gessardii]|uniref:cbb3-type cytochrome c oxidase subunit 3 n=1 Tax=Pseudomonas gessardii TaxID=78544 RepID=UPI0014741137|nr:cbb3-type cytochrome c oxidase subunit 3 [Pseudomonas gessardii]NNA68845.1 cbb3-type cytochrome c oxidase subunit 3 [Pseudomonas gessardii]NNA91762.1 cbb3-type cytochrome c oxidase subunit 3 [Pseudomonas gessardii]
MWEVIFNLAAVICLYGAVEYCLRDQSGAELDEASLIPFADDPEVARRVELATGKPVKAVAPEEAKPGWGNVEV